MTKYIVGIDEAGRGPLAGPVAVGAVCVKKGFNWRLLPGVNDSKKLSQKQREAIFMRAKELQRDGILQYRVAMVGSGVIDRSGITRAVRLGIVRTLNRLDIPPDLVEVKLDGLLKAPDSYVYQNTIVKGDQKEKVIGLASILAKVTRDRYMVRMASKYPGYGFEQHKGYGTKEHLKAIRLHGGTPIHRTSFIIRA